jgi:hypothetical protein
MGERATRVGSQSEMKELKRGLEKAKNSKKQEQSQITQ